MMILIASIEIIKEKSLQYHVLMSHAMLAIKNKKESVEYHEQIDNKQMQKNLSFCRKGWHNSIKSKKGCFGG